MGLADWRRVLAVSGVLESPLANRRQPSKEEGLRRALCLEKFSWKRKYWWVGEDVLMVLHAVAVGPLT